MPRTYFTFTLLLLGSSIVVFVVLEELGFHLEPYWIAIAALCIPLAVALIHRFPAALIPLIFISEFKVQPAASNLDFHDPTLWALLLLLLTILVHALLTLVGIEHPPLGDLVRGQPGGIVTYLVFVGVVALSYLYSLAPEYGFKTMTHFVVFGSVLYFASLFLVRSEADIRHLITSTVLFAIVLAGYEFLFRQPETVEDPTKLGLGELTGTALLLLLLAPKAMRVRLPLPLLLLCVLWLVAGLTISIARGPMLSFIFMVVLSLLTSKRDSGLLPRKAMAVMLVVLVVPTFLVSLFWLRSTAPEKLERKEGELSKLLELSDPGGTAGKRLGYYKQALEGFEEKPILGWGSGSFGAYARGTDMRLYPHNLVLLVAMEQGLVGLTALAAFSVALAGALKKTIVATGGEWLFLLWIVLYCLSTSMFSGDLNDQRVLTLWCGVAFASWRILKLRFQEQPPVADESARVPPSMLPRSLVYRNQALRNR
jgi:O-antigen ligase